MANVTFVDVMSDEGFKRVFGVEENMILLLEAAFQDRKIRRIKYLDKEKFGLFRKSRRSIYDLHCEDDAGRTFIVEVQYKEVDNFINRSVYYVANCLQKQAKPGKDWNNAMDPVYFLALLSFNLSGTPEDQWLHRFELREERSGQRMTENLRFVYIELGKFDKKDGELLTDQDRMAFFMKNAGDLRERPKSMGQKMYDNLFSAAAFAGMDRKQQEKYMNWWRIRQDNYNADRRAKRIAREEGLAEGRAEGMAEGRAEGEQAGSRAARIEIARELQKMQMDEETISRITGLDKMTLARL